MSFYDEYGMPNPSANERSTNGILFLVELMLLGKLKYGHLSLQHRSDFHVAVEAMSFNSHREFSQTPWTTVKEDRASHDNVTAIASMSYVMGWHYHKNISLKYYPHPRDMIYYGLLAGKLWAYPLMPILSAIMIHSCWRNYKAPNGMPDTDGKLLAWVRLHSYPMSLTKRLCDAGIKKHFGGWRQVFETYFQHPENPVRLLAQEVYP